MAVQLLLEAIRQRVTELIPHVTLEPSTEQTTDPNRYFEYNKFHRSQQSLR